jgi:hypothetical protein
MRFLCPNLMLARLQSTPRFASHGFGKAECQLPRTGVGVEKLCTEPAISMTSG